MAKAKRNIKTHPKPTGDDVQDDYMPPDRPDVNSGQDSGRTEVVDVFGKETVTVEGGEDEGRVDLDSGSEGDARSMASEGSGDGRTDLDDPNRRVNARTTRSDRTARGNDSDDEGGYGAKVRKRIARERALVNRERALREQTQKQLTEERAARQAQDDRIAKLERATAEVAGNSTVKEVEAQIAALRPQLAAAMEAGETAKSLELQEKLSDLKAKLEVLKYDLQQKQRLAEAAATTRTTSTTTTTTETDTGPVNAEAIELANQFKKANRHWWNRSANKGAREDAFVIDREILQEIADGDIDFEPYSDEHFEEMARRLHEAHPHLELQDLDGQPYNFDDEDDMNDRQDRRNGGNNGRQNGARQQQGRGNAPVGRMGQNGRKAPNEVELARQGKVQLDESDFSTMRLFKMDPNDPNAKKYFAKEKMRSILNGQRGNDGGSR